MDVKMDEKTIMFVDNNEDMEMTQSHTVKISERSVQKPVESSSEKLDFKCFLTRMNDKNSNNFQCNETTLFSADNEDMEMTQSHTVNIKEKSVNKAGISSSSAQANFKYFLDSIHENKPNEGPTAQTNYFNSDKTIVFSTGNEDMEITQSHTVNISDRTVRKAGDESLEKLDFRMFLHRMNNNNPKSCLTEQSNNFQCNKTVMFSSDNEDMEMTQSDTANIREKSVKAAESSFAKSDFSSFCSRMNGNNPNASALKQTISNHNKTSVFSAEEEDMEMTQSHTININEKSVRRPTESSTKNSNFDAVCPRRSRVVPREETNDIHYNKTIVFSADNEDMEMTQSHTVNINEKPVRRPTNSSYVKSDFTKVYVNVNGNNSKDDPPEETVFNSDKTIIFSTNNEDMEMTQSHTVDLSNKPMNKAAQSSLKKLDFKQFLARIHENKPVGPTKPTDDFLLDKTVVFSADNEDMEMTESHTINLKAKSLNKSAISSSANSDFKHFHGSVCENKHTESLTAQTNSVHCDKTMVFSADLDDMEMTQSHTVNINDKTMKNVGKSSLGKSDFSLLLTKKNDKNLIAGPAEQTNDFHGNKTIIFSDVDGKDMEMTQSHTANIKDISVRRTLGSSRGETNFKFFDRQHSTDQTSEFQCCNTIVFSADNEDMEMTQSHTVNINDKSMRSPAQSSFAKSDLKNIYARMDKNDQTLHPAEQTHDFQSNKTIMFAGDNEDMEITQGNTVNINDKCMRRPVESSLGKSQASTSFMNMDGNISDQSVAGQTLLHPNKTVVFSADNEDMELTKSHTVNINDKHMKRAAESFFATSNVKNLQTQMNDNNSVAGTSGQMSDSQCNKTIVFSAASEDMDLTQSHTVNISDKPVRKTPESSLEKLDFSNLCSRIDGNKPNTGPVEQTVFQGNKTIVFSSDSEAMEMTQSHTININEKSVRRPAESSTKNSNFDAVCHRRSGVVPREEETNDIHYNKTIVFSAVNEDMEMTQSHTVNINEKPVRRPTNSSDVKSDFTKVYANVNGNNSKNDPLEQTVFNSDKTIVFLTNNGDMEMTQSHTVDISNKSVNKADQSSLEKLGFKQFLASINENKPVGPTKPTDDFLLDKTVVFSADNEDMEMTESHTINLKAKSLNKSAISSSANSDFKHFHGSVCENKPTESLTVQTNSVHCDKTIVFSADLEDMEMTQSHTVNLNDKTVKNVGKSSLGKSDFSLLLTEKNDKHLIAGPAEQTNDFHGNKTIIFSNVNGTTFSKCSKTIVLSNVNEDLELAQRHSVSINDNSTSKVLKSSFGELDFSNTCSHLKENNPNAGLTEQTVSKCKRTIPISTNNEDMEMTQSHTVNINQKDVKATDLDTKETSCLQKDNAKCTFQKAVTDQEKYFSKQKSLGMFLPKLPNKRKLCTSDTAPVNLLHLEGNSTASSQNTSPKGATGSKTSGQCWPQAKISAVPDIKKEVCPDFDQESSSKIHHSDKTQLDCEESEEHLATTTDLEQYGNGNMDMEMTQSHTANIKDISVRRTLGSPRGETNFKIFNRQHSTDQTSEFQCCNTIVFSADNEDMEMTQSHTVNINDKSMRRPAQSSFAKTDLKNIYARMDKNHQTRHPAEQTHDFQSNKTIMFAGDNEDMEITQSNTVNKNDKCMRRPVESSLGKSQASTSFMNMDGNISDQSVAGQTLLHPNKTVMFSADNEDMELTKSHTVNINDKHMKRAAELFCATSNVKNLQTQMNDNNSVAGTSGQMSDSQCNKTIVFSAASEDMNLTQSHTVNISDKPVRKAPESSLEKLDFSNLCSRIDGNNLNTGPMEQTVFQGNKTIVFSSDNEAMEMTQSHTININEKSVQIAADSFFTKSNVKNLNTQMNDGNSTVGPSGQMSDSLHNKTIAFSAGNENRALTQSHTVNINEKSVRKAPESSFMKSDFTSSCSNLNENNRSTSPEEQIVLQGPKTIVFSSDNEDMEVSQIHDKSGEKTAEFCLGKLNVNANVNGNCTNGDQTGDSKCSKTIVFSNVNEDLELAQRHSVNINDNSTSKVLKSSFGELDFSNTCSHLKENNPNAGLTEQIVSKCKRTIPISTNNEDMEMTQSHTVNINQKDVKATDLDTKETSCLQKDNAKSTFQKAVTDQERYFSKRKSLGMFLPKLPNKRKLCTSDTTPVNLLHLEGNSTASSQNTNPKGATGSKTFGQCWPHAKISAVPDIKKEVCPDFDLESSSEIHHSDKTQLDCEESEEHLAKTTDLEQPHQMFQSPRTKSLDSTLDSFEVSGEKRFKAGILQESDTGQQSLLDGSITVREFMQLLEVNMDIQKPRQSQLPPNCFSDVTPALDDWLKEKYIYEPQLQVWEEDYQTQSNLIDSLQLEMSSLDKRLIELNEPFWEKIRTYSLGQLNNLGLGITEKNSYFRKEAKMLFNERKMKLYTEMINIAELEEQKLKQKITKCDEVIFGIEQLFASVEDKKNKESEFLSLKLEQKQLTLESVIKEVKNEIQKQEEVIWKLKSQIEDYQSISVWTISEWLSEKACFRFLEDSFEIEVKFGDPLADILFCEKPAHKIDEVKFYTLLDEGNCKPSYAVVHRLLRQFVHSKCSWNQDCTTQRDLPMLLHEFSLVTTRYHSLGEEIENLITNGSLKYYILNLEIRNTDLKILFSSYISFVKFEVTFCLTHHYPTSSLQIVNFKNYIGETSFAQFEDVVSSVSKGPHHLTRVVDKIYQEFLSKDYKLPLFV
uniref:Knl1 C-terminal RWD domain-containing protein n=1 Tax=Erpetoichthys calabaricus TaxID=27687 RepID=A0A8C4SPZ9_ERPCA